MDGDGRAGRINSDAGRCDLNRGLAERRYLHLRVHFFMKQRLFRHRLTA